MYISTTPKLWKMYARIIDSRNFWRAAAGGQARSQRITRGRKNQFLRRNSIKEKIRVRQTDGRSERRTENLLYGTIYLQYCTAQITKVTFLKKISAPKIYSMVVYGTNHKSYISNLKKKSARPRISYTYILCIVVS